MKAWGGLQDPSCFPEGLLWDVLGQKSALQRKCSAVPMLTAGTAVPLVGLPSSSNIVPLALNGLCMRGVLRLLAFICCYLSII